MLIRPALRPDERPKRGVYRHDWLRNGCFVFYAVDSRGEYVAELATDCDRLSETTVHAFLEEILNLCDPECPVLRLVTLGAPPHLSPE